MTAPVSRAAVLDTSAITLSGLCVIHCLALPVMAAFLPVAGVWAEAEWVHKVFVLFAVPVSGLAIWQSFSSPGGRGFVALATVGL